VSGACTGGADEQGERDPVEKGGESLETRDWGDERRIHTIAPPSPSPMHSANSHAPSIPAPSDPAASQYARSGSHPYH